LENDRSADVVSFVRRADEDEVLFLANLRATTTVVCVADRGTFTLKPWEFRFDFK